MRGSAPWSAQRQSQPREVSLGGGNENFIGVVGQKTAGYVAVVEEVVAVGVGRRRADGHAGGDVEQGDGHVRQARLAGILDAVAVEVLPNAIADLQGGRERLSDHVPDAVGLAEGAGRVDAVEHVRLGVRAGVALGARAVIEPADAAGAVRGGLAGRASGVRVRVEGRDDHIGEAWNLLHAAERDVVVTVAILVARRVAVGVVVLIIIHAAARPEADAGPARRHAAGAAVAFQRPRRLRRVRRRAEGGAGGDALLRVGIVPRVRFQEARRLIAVPVADAQRHVAGGVEGDPGQHRLRILGGSVAIHGPVDVLVRGGPGEVVVRPAVAGPAA